MTDVHASPDVAIVGGGVAGSSLAIVLRRHGLGVHLIEREPAFRDRIRGEAVHVWGTTELRRLGLLDLAIEQADATLKPIWQTYRQREAQEPYRWADDFPDSPNGLGVDHVALQNALIAEAARAGVTVHRPARVTLDRSDGRPALEVRHADGVSMLRPRLVVGADGERSAVRAWIGGIAVADPPHHHLGGMQARGLGLPTDRIHQAYFTGGFLFASPLARDLTRVYLVCSSEEAMRLQRGPDVAAAIVDRFRDAMPPGAIPHEWAATGPAGFFPNSSVSVTAPPGADVVLIGDAAGRNDPSQGHGLSLVFHDVRILRDLLLAGSWEGVPDEFHACRARSFETLRQHAHWTERLSTETGPEIDAIRERMRRARELDPTAGGFDAIFANGPDGLTATEAARRHFFGEDLPDA